MRLAPKLFIMSLHTWFFVIKAENEWHRYVIDS
jgi:hypothetical protein